MTAPADIIVAVASSAADDPNAFALDVGSVVPISGAKKLCGNDIVALRLSHPTKVVPLAPRLDAPPMDGERVSVVGFGNIQPGDDASAGKLLRRDDATITHVGARPAGPEHGEMAAEDLAVSIGACKGDSGGPALVDNAVVGVMSRGDSRTCTDMMYTRLDVHAPWLRNVVRDAAEARGGTAPPWAIAKDEPTDDAGLPPPGSSGAAPVSAASGDSSGKGCSFAPHARGACNVAALAGLAAALAARRRLRRRARSAQVDGPGRLEEALLGQGEDACHIPHRRILVGANNEPERQGRPTGCADVAVRAALESPRPEAIPRGRTYRSRFQDSYSQPTTFPPSVRCAGGFRKRRSSW